MNNNYNQNQVPGNAYTSEHIQPQNTANYNQYNYQNQQPNNNQYIPSYQPITPHKNNSTIIAIIIVVVVIISILSILGFIIIGSSIFIGNKELSSITSVIEQNEKDEQINSNINGKFIMAGKEFNINDDYSSLEEKGWTVNFSELKEEEQTLDAGYKTLSLLRLENTQFPDAYVTIGLSNDTKDTLPLSKCKYWALTVDNTYSNTPVDFSFGNGIKKGSSLQEVEAVYGIPEESDIYRSDSLKYTEYTYNYDYEIYLKLTIYDATGLTNFSYKIY